MRFLIAEGDATLNKMIQKALNENGYKTDEALNIDDARYFTNIRSYDLIIIDNNFDETDVLNFISEIRISFPTTKIIVISDNTTIQTEIKILQEGADDFIKKPLHFELLLARIEANIRYTNIRQITINDLIISPSDEKIIYKSKIIELKGKPFEVFIHLVKHPNQVISKEQLLDAIWEEPELVTPNVIEVAINQIRQKIDKPLGITTVETVRRRGYKFAYNS